MSTINANIADYLKQIEALTKTNLQLLNTINSSFSTKKSNLMIEVDDTYYVVPSFIALENKINLLQENFDNLVKAPEYGEAAFNFNGNTRTIEVRKYNSAPPAIDLNANSINNNPVYSIETNELLRDMLTISPCVKFDLSGLADDIVDVNIKKVIPKSDAAIRVFNSLFTASNDNADSDSTMTQVASMQGSYSDIIGALHESGCSIDNDYVEYDKIYKLPIKQHTGSGEYIIEEVVDDYVNEYLENIIKVKISSSTPLTYKLFSDIETSLYVGNELTTYDGTGKVVITNVNTTDNILTLKVVNGEYMNIIGTAEYNAENGIDDNSKLRFLRTGGNSEFNADKYIKVPFENDKYVFITVAPVNSRLGVQSSWGKGLIIDTTKLKNNNIAFNTYYTENVKNIGHILKEIALLFPNQISGLHSSKFDTLTSVKPSIDNVDLKITWINNHIENSTASQTIHAAHNAKITAEQSLTEIDDKIKSLNADLQKDGITDSEKVAIKNDLTTKYGERIEALKNITASITAISNTDTSGASLETAKYRIRGFYDPMTIGNSEVVNHTIGIRVRYRYTDLNGNNSTTTYNDGNGNQIAFNTWNEVVSYKFNNVTYNESNGCYVTTYENVDGTPEYNQVDIPITKGERVEVKFQLIYDYGQPFTNMTSKWSDAKTIEFTDSTPVDGQSYITSINNILQKNNADIEKYKFTTVLENEGVVSHIKGIPTNDTFLHKAEHIDSGVSEDGKNLNVNELLKTLKNKVSELENVISGITEDGSHYEVCTYLGSTNSPITVNNSTSNTLTYAYDNVIKLDGYDTIKSLIIDEINKNGEQPIEKDGYVYDPTTGIMSTNIFIGIHNTGNTPLKLYSIFPGEGHTLINDTSSTYVDKSHYSYTEGNVKGGVWIETEHEIGNEFYEYAGTNSFLQTNNQFITFRVDDVWDNTKYYTKTADGNTEKQQTVLALPEIDTTKLPQMVIYPHIVNYGDLTVDTMTNCHIIEPGKTLYIQLYCGFINGNQGGNISKVISFDLRTNLHHEPKNYKLTIVSNELSTSRQTTAANGTKEIMSVSRPIGNTSIINRLSKLFTINSLNAK